jgi:hypothetical protein
VRVPIFHNDVAGLGRQLDVDLLAIDRYPITTFESDWRARPADDASTTAVRGALDATAAREPVFYPSCRPAGTTAGTGYAQLREQRRADAIDATTRPRSPRGTL